MDRPGPTSLHKATQGKARQTFGHGYAVAPWGDVIADCGTSPALLSLIWTWLLWTRPGKVPSLPMIAPSTRLAACQTTPTAPMPLPSPVRRSLRNRSTCPQSADARLAKGMELSHFSVLNHLAHVNDERSPAASPAFHLTRGAITNTLTKLEWAGHIHIRPDWDDAPSVSPSAPQAKSRGQRHITVSPIITEIVEEIGPDRVRQALPVLRELREKLGSKG